MPLTRRSYLLPLLACLVVASAGGAQDAILPPPPDGFIPTIRSTLSHGVSLLAEGDFEFAEAHFRALLPSAQTPVYINASVVPPPMREQARAAARDAMQAWNDALDQRVVFIETRDESTAQVVIHFEHEIVTRHEDHLDFVCGMTRTQAVHHGRQVHRAALVRIAIHGDGADRPPHRMDNWRHIVGHELGHVLGLDESRDLADIMGPDIHRRKPSTTPSERDVRQVLELAALADQLTVIARQQQMIEVPEAWRVFAGTDSH